MDIADNRARNRILLVLFVGVLMGALDITIVAPALPAIRAQFGVDARLMAWVFTIYVLFNLVSAQLMGKLSDAFGRRSIYALDVTLFALGSLVVALSPTFGVVLVGRAMQGIGAGGIFPVASAVIGDTFPHEKRGSALGLIGAVFGVAFLVGPILAGVILKLAGWHWLFLINLPIAALVIVMSLRALPATRPARRRRFDLPGVAVLGALLASLTYGVNQLDTAHFAASLGSTNVWPFLLAAVVLLSIFYRVERRATDPVLRIGLFGSRQVGLAAGLAAGAGLGEAAIVFVPALLVAAFGVSEYTASFMLLPAVLAMAVGSPVSGRMLDRYGSKVVVLTGNTLTTIGLLIAGLFSTNLALFYLAAVLVGLGLSSLLGATLRYIMLNETPASERAAAQGALSLFTGTGQMLGGAIVGGVAASRGGGVAGYETALLIVGAVTLVLTLAALTLKGRAEELATVKDNEVAGGRGTGGRGQNGEAAATGKENEVARTEIPEPRRL